MKTLLKEIVKPIYYYIKNKNLREFYKLYDRYGKFGRYVEVKDVKFLSYSFDVPDVMSFIWQFKEIFVEEIYKFNSDSDSPIIYDCGANIGMSCLYFKKLYPNSKIKAFEADPKLVKTLRKNLAKNRILEGIEIIDKAVWIDYNGVEFSVEGADAGSIYGSRNKIKVASIRLKDFLETEERIDMLKIDIEGAEYEVLKDCKNSLNKVKNLFVEYHSWNKTDQKLSEILKIFEENGFRYYIENLTKRKTPFVNKGELGDMDLQLNIFGIRR
ncbi:MAG TPA: FkbM family methyltransferase [Hydrogenothermaceae bacterium]|nr:FkbM family methyltransferase [Hydrogenothermaceae bacterium]